VRTGFSTALATVILALATGLAIPHAAADRDRPRVADRDDARGRARQKIRALRAMILVQELGLDEATAGRIGPVLARHDDELERLAEERKALRKALRAALAANDDKKLDGLVDQLQANQKARWDREQTRFAEVRKLLTPRQAARLVEVLPQVDRRILQGLRRAVGGADLDADDGDAGDADPAPTRPRRPRRR
jgi:Spy/CpxP family protein refolding chaperone